MHVIENLAIAIPYLVLIPIATARIVRKAALDYGWLWWLGILFVVSCGVGHLAEALEWPAVRVIHDCTAVISNIMAIALFYETPKIVHGVRSREALRESLSQQNSQLQGILATVPGKSAIAIWDKNMCYVDDFPDWRKMYGLPPEESLKGQSHYEVFSGIPQEWKKQHQAVLEHGVIFFENEGSWFTRNDGSRVCLLFGIGPWYNRDGTIGGMVGNAIDVTEQKTLEIRLTELSTLDELTQIWNRRKGEEELEQLIDKNDEATILFIDLNKFKGCNDTMGHATGDAVLRVIAERLNAIATTHTGFISRHGGDEFLMGFPGCDEVQYSQICDRLIASLDERINTGEGTVSVGCSIGVACSNKAANSSELLSFGDAAMYAAKAISRDTHRSTWRVFDAAMLEQYRDDVAVQRDLQGAIANEEMRLWYQPIVDVKTGQVTAFEALVRWQHPRLGLLPPSRFLPQVAKQGLDEELCNWVLDKAIRQIYEWKTINPLLKISCNVEPAEIISGFAMDTIDRVLTQLQSEDGIKLELLERGLDRVVTRDAIAAIIKHGLGLLVDDFGQDNANFFMVIQLRRLTPNIELKLDRQMIVNIDKDSAVLERNALKAIVEFAHALDIRIIAEGVETKRQFEIVKRLGIDAVQGYYVARPMPADEAEKLLT